MGARIFKITPILASARLSTTTGQHLSVAYMVFSGDWITVILYWNLNKRSSFEGFLSRVKVPSKFLLEQKVNLLPKSI